MIIQIVYCSIQIIINQYDQVILEKIIFVEIKISSNASYMIIKKYPIKFNLF
jgi:hypothetical protein